MIASHKYTLWAEISGYIHPTRFAWFRKYGYERVALFSQKFIDSFSTVTAGLTVSLSLGLRHLVSPHVQWQMVATREFPITEVASKGFVSGVLAVMSGQLVASRELPLTVLPGTRVRFLTYRKKRNTVRSSAVQHSTVHNAVITAQVGGGWWVAAGGWLKSLFGEPMGVVSGTTPNTNSTNE